MYDQQVGGDESFGLLPVLNGRSTGILQRIGQFKGERRGNFQILFIGDRNTGDAPFHDRYILSKDSGWQVGTSLKNVGKGNETNILKDRKLRSGGIQ
jgi:hypothetical protein